MKKIFKKYIVLIIFLGLAFFVGSVNAQLLSSDGSDEVIVNMERAGSNADYNIGGGPGNFLISDVATIIVTAFLSLLGIIFLIMVILGGFFWMTAAGNDDKVASGKKTLLRGVIGLIIVVTAYVISYFVFNALAGISGI